MAPAFAKDVFHDRRLDVQKLHQHLIADAKPFDFTQDVTGRRIELVDVHKNLPPSQPNRLLKCRQ